ncbi:MAG: hypothetical protein V4598_01460 [Bdellovibrionota bacterium]
MKLFKLILFFFAIYFIRRFWQMYRAMERRGQELQARENAQNSAPKEPSPTNNDKIVDAEFKVIDRN